MMPTLRHIPPRAITHIPGPPRIGSKRPRATLGILNPAQAVGAGIPDGGMMTSYISSTPSGNAPVWFAVSDGGAGYIPWGSWQVAFYALGDPLPPSTNLAFVYQTVQPGDVAALLAGSLWAGFQTLRQAAITAGFTRAADIRIDVRYVNQLSPNPTGEVTITAPYGVPLQVFYEGPFYYISEGNPLPMVSADPGYDNPLMLALWSPGNRAILRATESAGPSRYPGYPYPYPPYHGPDIIG